MNTEQLTQRIQELEDTQLYMLEIIPAPECSKKYIRDTLIQLQEEDYGK